MSDRDVKIEIEVKIRIVDISSYLGCLIKLGFTCVFGRAHEYNIVYDTDNAALTQRRCLLRLRKWGETALLTVKTPPRPDEKIAGFKTRREVEVLVEDFEKMNAILLALGYVQTFCYEKFRSQYKSPEGLIATLDETPIGIFSELEGKPELIHAYIPRLGYCPKDAITQNYRSLFLEAGYQGDMLFSP